MSEIRNKQVIIIGGGPGGLAAAAELKRNGIGDILILEREHSLGVSCASASMTASASPGSVRRFPGRSMPHGSSTR